MLITEGEEKQNKKNDEYMSKKYNVSRIHSVVSRLRSFYKPGSKKIGLNFRAPKLIQKYENTSGYDNFCVSKDLKYVN